jgi:hypothetical protein
VEYCILDDESSLPSHVMDPPETWRFQYPSKDVVGYKLICQKAFVRYILVSKEFVHFRERCNFVDFL